MTHSLAQGTRRRGLWSGLLSHKTSAKLIQMCIRNEFANVGTFSLSSSYGSIQRSSRSKFQYFCIGISFMDFFLLCQRSVIIRLWKWDHRLNGLRTEDDEQWERKVRKQANANKDFSAPPPSKQNDPPRAVCPSFMDTARSTTTRAFSKEVSDRRPFDCGFTV